MQEGVPAIVPKWELDLGRNYRGNTAGGRAGVYTVPLFMFFLYLCLILKLKS